MIAMRGWIAVAGFVVGAAGATLEIPWLIWAAIGLLSVALLLRLIAAYRNRLTASAPDSLSAAEDE
jgi:hypothetical protein